MEPASEAGHRPGPLGSSGWPPDCQWLGLPVVSTPIPSGSKGSWATLQLAKVSSVSPVPRWRMGSLSDWDMVLPLVLPLGLQTVTGQHPSSVPAAVLPDLLAAGEPPAVACVTRMKALEQEVLALRLLHWHALAGPCNCQGCRCCKRQRNRFYIALVAWARISQSFLSKNTSCQPSLAAARVTLWPHANQQQYKSLRVCVSSLTGSVPHKMAQGLHSRQWPEVYDLCHTF